MIRQPERESRLVYDSARVESAIGTRAGPCVDRSLLFQSGCFAVDVVIHAVTRDVRFLHGQMIQEEAGAPVSGAIVRLEGSDETVQTDEHGQFALSGGRFDERQTLHIETGGIEVAYAIPASND